MRQRKTFLVITFSETADAMAAERQFGMLGIPGRIIPIPRQLSAGCGLSWRTEQDQQQRAKEVLQEAGIHWEAMEPVSLMI